MYRNELGLTVTSNLALKELLEKLSRPQSRASRACVRCTSFEPRLETILSSVLHWFLVESVPPSFGFSLFPVEIPIFRASRWRIPQGEERVNSFVTVTRYSMPLTGVGFPNIPAAPGSQREACRIQRRQWGSPPQEKGAERVSTKRPTIRTGTNLEKARAVMIEIERLGRQIEALRIEAKEYWDLHQEELQGETRQVSASCVSNVNA